MKKSYILKVFICILFLLQAGGNCYAADIAKKFEGVWRRSDSQSSWMEGDVKIDNCIKNSCKVNLRAVSYIGHMCSFEGSIKVTSPNTALFKERNVIIEFRLLDDVSLSIKGVSGDWWQNCGSGANFEGEYRNLKAKYKTSFNCIKAKTKIEALICENKDLANSDYTLSELYRALKERSHQKLVTSQRKWIFDRDSCEELENLKGCLINKYQERILILKNYFSNWFGEEYKNLKVKTHETDFNCSEANTKIEALICKDEDLANFTYIISDLYKILKEKIIQQLVTSQKEWIVDRDSCEKSENPKECLINKYQERISIFEQYVLSQEKWVIDPASDKTSLQYFLKSQDNKNLDMTISKEAIVAPYNFNYLMWLTSNGWVDLSLLRNDPLLMNYLKANLPEQAKHVMDTHFDYMYTESHDGNEIIIEGRARGSIEPINRGAIAVTKDNGVWFAYTDNNVSPRQIVVIFPGNKSLKRPLLLHQWIMRMLPDMDTQDIRMD